MDEPPTSAGRWSFPRGSKGACHPFNVKSFALNAECSKLYENATGLPVSAWKSRVSALHGFAVQVQNCSTVLQCSIGMLFLNAGCFLTPGYDMSARWDYWRISYWKAMVLRVQRLQRRSLRRYRSQLRSAEELRPGAERPAAEEVTIGIHADKKSAEGPWQGQINAWKAFAEMHGHQFLLDVETYFTGKVFARFLGMYWASATKSDDNFWLKYPFLRPGERFSPGGFAVPSEGSILDARLDDRELVNKLWITSLPPPYWDSLAALNASLTKSPWTVWIDYDLAISPCCFDSFSFTNLIGRRQDGGLPHVVFRDSPHEDYHHHCANNGFIMVRNSVVGRRFLEMALEKRPWPAVPYGDQSAVAESLLELLGLEAETFGDASRTYQSQCMPHLALGMPMGDFSYASYCRCWRSELDRMVGLQRDQSRWVQFLVPRKGPEMGFLLASTFLYKSGKRGVGFLPLFSWSQKKHLRFVDSWFPPNADFGGPCGLLPLVVHWASLPYRPAMIYDFLASRFQSLPQELFLNGSVAELKQGFLQAAAEGRKQWQQFRHQELSQANAWTQPQNDLEVHLQEQLEKAGCNIGSHRVWYLGGWNRSGW